MISVRYVTAGAMLVALGLYGWFSVTDDANGATDAVKNVTGSVKNVIDTAYSNPCTESDRKNIAYIGADYEPEVAYEFGKKIQAALISNDSQQFVDMFVGEMSNGPSIRSMLSKNIRDVFTEEELNSVLTAIPSCSPFNSYGYMLGPGTIWYAYYGDGAFKIAALNVSSQDENELDQTGWVVNNKMMSPYCFEVKWRSDDNFEQYSDRFNVSLADLYPNIGYVFGKQITKFDSIEPSWCEGDSNCEGISLIHPLKECRSENYRVKGNSILVGKDFDSKGYELLKPIDTTICEQLAPSIDGKCIEAYIVRVTGYRNAWYGLYGLFDLTNYGEAIVPLRYFESKPEAMEAEY